MTGGSGVGVFGYKLNGEATRHETSSLSFTPGSVLADGAHTPFCLATREYVPRYTDDEFRFMRFLLYDKAKFVPLAGSDAPRRAAGRLPGR